MHGVDTPERSLNTREQPGAFSSFQGGRPEGTGDVWGDHGADNGPLFL